MTNPARELFTIIDGWRKPQGSSAARQRGLGSPEGWDVQIRAVQLLVEIERSLHYLEDRGAEVHAFLSAVPAWRETIFHYARSWNNDSTVASRLDMLQACIPLLDAHLGAEPDLSEVRSKIEDIVLEVMSDESLDAMLRGYIAKLAAHINSCLEEFDSTGKFGLADALYELSILIDSAGVRTGDANKRAKYQAFSDFLRHPLTNTALVVTGGLVAGLLQSS